MDAPCGVFVVNGLDGSFGVGNGSSIDVLSLIATGSVELRDLLWIGKRWVSRLQ